MSFKSYNLLGSDLEYYRHIMIVVIDGPAGSGKSSTARAVASRTGLNFLDSGAFYRAVTMIYLNCNSDEELFFDVLRTKPLRFEFSNGEFNVYLEGKDVSKDIRKQAITNRVSEVAAISEVRDYVNQELREFVQQADFIADGRDLGTVVFPHADFKFFFVADVRLRAQRRYEEMLACGHDADLQAIYENLLLRDMQDSSRDTAPLRKADDAVEVDTGLYSLEEQIQLVINHIGR
jgi:CMP/dCMP kinase